MERTSQVSCQIALVVTMEVMVMEVDGDTMIGIIGERQTGFYVETPRTAIGLIEGYIARIMS